MAEQWPEAQDIQLPQVSARVSALATDDEYEQPSHAPRPTLKRSRKYTLQNSFSNRFKRQRTSSERSSSADYPRSSSPLYDIAKPDSSSNSTSSSSSKDPTPSEPGSTQRGTSRRTSLIAQFIQRFARPLKCLPTSSNSKETSVVIPLHLREGALAADLYPNTVKYSDHDLQHHLYNNLAHVGMASIPNVNSYLNANPAAGPSNYYTRPDFRNFRARGRARKIFPSEDVHGNPPTPAGDTNCDASVDSQKWRGIRPGTPRADHEIPFFPRHPSNVIALNRAPKNSPYLGNQPANTRPGTSDGSRNSTQTQGRFSSSDLSEQISVLELPLSMPTAHRNRTTCLAGFFENSTHGSNLPSPTTFIPTTSPLPPSSPSQPIATDSPCAQPNANPNPDTSPTASLSTIGPVPRSQPIDIPQVPRRNSRRASLRRVQSLEHLRALPVSTQAFGPLDTASRESTSPRRAFEGPARSRVSSTIRIVESGDQGDDGCDDEL